MPPTIRCPNCNSEADAWARGGSRNFCSAQCRLDFNARAKVQGAAVISLAKAWRLSRGSTDVGKRAFQELTAILDMLNAADKEAGRPPVTDHVRRNLDFGIRYVDRSRSTRLPTLRELLEK